ncbi:MAG: hypothetical protein U1E81_16420 [Xanthobacteraceae bacterium]
MLNKAKFAGAALAAIVLLGGLAAGASQAQAGGFRHGFHGGGFGGGFGGGQAYFPGCRWAPKYNFFGDYVGLVRVCRY